MKNYFTKKSAWKTLSVFVSFFLLMEVLGSVFPAQGVFAQTPPTTAPTQPTKVDESTLTAATGWTKGTSSYDALSATTIDTWTNSNGDKANCEVSYQFQGLSQCTVTYPNGTQSQTTTVTAAPGMNGTTDTSIGADNHITAQTQTPTPPASGKGCSISPSDWGNCVAVAVAAVALMMAGLVGALLGIVGALFNWIVVITIFRFGDYFGNSAGLLTAWGILRDVGNIMLLFGFIFMGVVMILDLHTIDTRKAIPQLIIVALLLNFSLFAAEAVIDVSNVLSASLYNQAGITGCSAGGTAATCANTGISAQVLSATGLSNIFSDLNGGIAGALGAIGTDPPHQMFVWIGITIFMTIVMVVLLAASIMLVIRAVVLVFVMVLAPLGFAAMVIPSLSGLGKQWRDALISQAFFAPVYLLLLLVSLKIMTAVKAALLANAPGTLLQALTDGNTSLGSIILVFVLISGFMIAALMTAKKMGAIGADFATSVATKTVRGTVLAPARIAAIPARQLAGGAASKFGRSYDTTIGKWRESSNPFLKGLALTSRGLGVDEAIGKGVQGVTSAKFGTNRSYAEDKKYRDERTQHLAHSAEIDHLQTEVKKGMSAKITDPNYANLKDAAERALSKMSQTDAEQLFKTTKDPTQRANLAKMLTAEKFEKAMESKDLNAEIQEQIAKDRYADVDKAHADYDNSPKTSADFDTFKQALRTLPARDKKLMARYRGDLFSSVIGEINQNNGESVLKADEIESMVKDDAYTATQRAKINSAKRTEQIKVAFDSAASPARTTAIQNLMRNMGKEAGKVDTRILTSAEVAPHLTQQHLASIVSEQEIKTQAEKDAILTNLRTIATVPPTAEYQSMQKYVRDNAAAKAFFGGNVI